MSGRGTTKEIVYILQFVIRVVKTMKTKKADETELF